MSHRIDIVTVFHNEKNRLESEALASSLDEFERGHFNFLARDNRVSNIGFAAGCNYAAALGTSPIIGLLNPDVQLRGAFIAKVEAMLSMSDIKITGMDFGKPRFEQRLWGVNNWVCGAVFFTTREWWEELGGFDEQFVWSHEETDFIRQTESRGFRCRPIHLPIVHSSPIDDVPHDIAYKERNFKLASEAFYRKWGR